ncbi:MAG TPA: hypothetical protein EYH06_12480 [Chromatiales bacterium]|nr:hypothetical protein [Chromatiales bacterium]
MEILMKKNSVSIGKSAVFFLLAAFASNAHSYTFTPTVGVKVEQHSNVGKDTANQEDTIVAPFVAFDYKEANSTISTAVNFNATHEEYLDDTFSSLNLVDINAFADWRIIPERFIWAFDDFATTQRISAIDTSSPDNLQTVNVFSTGPDFVFSEGIWSLLGKFRYGDTNYSETDEDSVFYGGSFAVQREINEYSRIASGVIYRTNDFDEASLSDYDVGKIFIDYARDLPSGKLLVGIGASYADINNEKDDTEPYFKLLLSYQPTGLFTVDLSAVNEFSDDAGRAYDATSSRQTGKQKAGTGLDESTQPGVYRSRKASLTGKYSASLFSWDITGFLAEKSFVEGGQFDVVEGTGFDTEEVGAEANVAWLLSERMTFNIGGSYKETDYPVEAFTDEEYKASASLGYRITRNLFTSVGVSREEKQSNDVAREFDDDVVFFSLFYKGGVK